MTMTRGDETKLPDTWRRWLAQQAPAEVRLRQAGFQAILTGRDVSARDLVAETGLAEADVQARLADLAARGLVEMDGRGVLVGCWGLTTRPTAHRLQLDGRPFYTWCAVDAIGIPAALEGDARVDSPCAGCGRPVRIDLVRGVPTTAPSEAIRLWVADIVPGRAMAGDT